MRKLKLKSGEIALVKVTFAIIEKDGDRLAVERLQYQVAVAIAIEVTCDEALAGKPRAHGQDVRFDRAEIKPDFLNPTAALAMARAGAGQIVLAIAVQVCDHQARDAPGISTERRGCVFRQSGRQQRCGCGKQVDDGANVHVVHPL